MFQKIVDVNVVYDYELYRLMYVKRKDIFINKINIYFVFFQGQEGWVRTISGPSAEARTGWEPSAATIEQTRLLSAAAMPGQGAKRCGHKSNYISMCLQ